METADGSLLQRAQGGDRAALAQLLKTVAPELFACAKRILGNRQDVEDVTQEALFAVSTHLHDLRAETTLRGYALTTLVRSALRARARRTKHAWADLENPASDEIDAEERVDRSRDLDRALDLITTLDGTQADTLALRFVQGYSIKEIAELMQVSENTVLSRIRLAKQHLRRRLSRGSGRRLRGPRA